MGKRNDDLPNSFDLSLCKVEHFFGSQNLIVRWPLKAGTSNNALYGATHTITWTFPVTSREEVPRDNLYSKILRMEAQIVKVVPSGKSSNDMKLLIRTRTIFIFICTIMNDNRT